MESIDGTTDPSEDAPGAPDSEATRPYEMRARQEAVDQTRDAILGAMAQLWLTRHYDEVTLGDVADLAGVTRQTVHRHFGTKDDLLIATAEWAGPRGERQALADPGDLDEAIPRLIAMYEQMGDANVRAVAIEGRVEAMDHLLKRGRSGHRTWVEYVFGPWLPPHGSSGRERAVMAFYAATDVMQWKLLRRDFGLSVEATTAIIRRLVDGLTATATDGRGDAS
jgi:AcrR family transcriptional regulator